MNKTLIITGASRGIGKAAAELFLKNDWRVINLARKPCKLSGVINIQLDLSDTSSLVLQQKLLLDSINQVQQICLVHNAAYYQKDRVDQMDAAAFRVVLEVNLVAPLILNKLVIPKMQKGSSIIYIGSTLSEKAVANNASYVISKHASVGMMRSTTQDLAKNSIHSCCICPGFTETEMLMQHLKNNPALIEGLSARVGANRLIQPAEIASLIFYAANNAVINGSVIHANLGQIEI